MEYGFCVKLNIFFTRFSHVEDFSHECLSVCVCSESVICVQLEGLIENKDSQMICKISNVDICEYLPLQRKLTFIAPSSIYKSDRASTQ